MKLYEAVQIGFFIYGWYKRATKDGDLTDGEIAELIFVIAEMLNDQ